MRLARAVPAIAFLASSAVFALGVDGLEARPEPRAQESKALVQETILLQRQSAQLKGQLDAAQQDLAKVREAHAALHGQVASLTDANARLQTTVRKTDASLKVTTKKLTKAEKEVQRLRQDLLAARKTLDELTRERLVLNRDNTRLTAERAELKPKADAFDALQRRQIALYRDLGAAYLNASQFDRAIEAYSASLQLDPKHADTHYYLGLLYQRLDGEAHRALAHLDKYLQLTSSSPSSKRRQEVERLVKFLRKEPDTPP